MSAAASFLSPGTWPGARARLLAGRCIRAVNYHNTPASRAEHYRRELGLLAERFAPVTEDDLRRLMTTGHWHKDRPGIIPSFFEGYRNNYEVAYPLLQEAGLVGWFFLPTGFLCAEVPKQRAYAEAHHIDLLPGDALRVAMSWDEVRDVARGHVVASHTRSHARLSPDAPEDTLLEEVLGPQLDFERELGRRARSFAWLYGGAYAPHTPAGRFLREAGYEFVFASLGIQRIAPNGRQGLGPP